MLATVCPVISQTYDNKQGGYRQDYGMFNSFNITRFDFAQS